MVLSEHQQTNAAIVENYLNLFRQMRFDEWGDSVLHPNATFRVMYPINGEMNVTNGRDNIVANFSPLRDLIREIHYTDTAVYQTTDPNVVVAVQTIHATANIGAEYHNGLVWIITMKDGQIFELQEYLNPSVYEAFLAALS